MSRSSQATTQTKTSIRKKVLMSTTYRERISKASLSPHLSYATGWTVRVWRAFPVGSDFNGPPGRTQLDADILSVIQRYVETPVGQLEIAKAILAIDHVNAVEITDLSGFGEVLYKDWP